MIIIVVGFLRRLHRPKYRVFNLKIVVKRNRAKTTGWSIALLRNATQDVEDEEILLKDDTSKPEQRFKAWAKNLCTRQALCQALGHENFTSVFQYQGGKF